MKMRYGLIAMAAAALVAAGAAVAGEGAARPFHVENSLHVAYDDNVTYASDGNEIDSFFFRESLTLSAEHNYDGGFLGLRYNPAFEWYEDVGDEDMTAWSHSADFVWSHNMSRRTSLTLSDLFAMYDRPEVVGSDGVIRQQDYSYAYNSVNAGLSTLFSERLRGDVMGRHQLLQYQEDEVGNAEDYTIYTVGLSLASIFAKSSSVFVDASYDDITYDGSGEMQDVSLPGEDGSVQSVQIPDRDANTYSAGLGVEHMFSPNLIGRLRAGYMFKDMQAADQSNESSPYGEGTITVVPSPAFRVSLNANYSMYQSGLLSYANQQRTATTLSLSYDMTAKLMLSVAGSYYVSDYSSDDAVDLVDPNEVGDGQEQAATFAARLNYRVTRNNTIELGYAYTQLDSDFEGRVDYGRNRYDVAWHIRL